MFKLNTLILILLGLPIYLTTRSENLFWFSVWVAVLALYLLISLINSFRLNPDPLQLSAGSKQNMWFTWLPSTKAILLYEFAWQTFLKLTIIFFAISRFCADSIASIRSFSIFFLMAAIAMLILFLLTLLFFRLKEGAHQFKK